jgi:hypothetical protein
VPEGFGVAENLAKIDIWLMPKAARLYVLRQMLVRGLMIVSYLLMPIP